MRVLFQRVTRAQVTSDGNVLGSIGAGLVALVGVTHEDSQSSAHYLARKTLDLRIFDDENGVMNRSIVDVHSTDPGTVGILVISQFTLYADTRKGRRPSYSAAAPPDIARPLVDCFISTLDDAGIPTSTGSFGAEMRVELVNDGPVTIMLDSDALGIR
jgi:D-aminoacyl-tRNA deacylase